LKTASWCYSRRKSKKSSPHRAEVFEKFLRDLINKRFIPNLSKSLVFDLGHVLDETRDKINALRRSFWIWASNDSCFVSRPTSMTRFIGSNCHVTPYLNFTLEFAPEFKLEGIPASSPTDNAAITEKDQNGDKDRWDIF
jgi:hypothetical protein